MRVQKAEGMNLAVIDKNYFLDLLNGRDMAFTVEYKKKHTLHK